MNFKPRSEATRQAIIEATAEIFNKKGYAGTSLSDLTEATQLTKGSIYGNFENKEDVALAAFEYNVGLIRAIVLERVEKANSFKDKLAVYTTIFTSKENVVFPKGGCPMLNMGTEADDTFEVMRQRVADSLMRWKNSIQSIIELGIEAKEFKADTNAEQIALTMVAITEGAMLLGRVTKNDFNLDTVLESVKTLTLSIEEKQ
jgi:TetR/AcrR family transcriptional regulator, transcriptional repressor for nem operon